jgi:hypothetical protein
VKLNFDWQTIIVTIIVIGAIIHTIKSVCFGRPKESKCHDCANKCENFKPKANAIWLKKE